MLVMLLVLAGISVPIYRGYVEDAAASAGKGDLAAVGAAIKAFQHDVGDWPLSQCQSPGATPVSTLTAYVSNPPQSGDRADLGLTTNPFGYSVAGCVDPLGAGDPRRARWKGPYLTVYPQGPSQLQVPAWSARYQYVWQGSGTPGVTPNVIYLWSWGLNKVQDTTQADLNVLQTRGDDILVFLRRL